MVRPDYRLITAVVTPLLIGPWLPPWDIVYLEGGVVGVIVLFTFMPVAEEVLFRGFLQGWLLVRDRFKHMTAGFSWANWLTSTVFACAHAWQHSLILVPGYFAVSMVLGHFRERYGGILVPVLLHIYYNLGLLFLAA